MFDELSFRESNYLPERETLKPAVIAPPFADARTVTTKSKGPGERMRLGSATVPVLVALVPDCGLKLTAKG